MFNRAAKHWLVFYTIIFIVVFAGGYITFFTHDLSIIWETDGVGQYYPAFVYIGKYLQNFCKGLLQGRWALPMFDLSIGMGEDIIGVLNYYGFGDPFNLISVLVTDANSAYLFSFAFGLRLYLSGLAFHIYCREMRLDPAASSLGAVCYAFCGFAIVGGARYIGWLSVLMYFPMILLGYEYVLKGRKRRWLFSAAAAYAAMCGFYYLYMASLCLAVYAAVRTIAVHGVRNYRLTVRTVCTAIGRYAIGIGIAAPILFPSLRAFMGSERNDINIFSILFDIKQYIPDISMTFFDTLLYVFHERTAANYASNITAVETAAVLLLFFLPGSRRKIQCMIAFIISAAAFHLPVTYYLFNAFVERNDRWVFFYHFVLAVILSVVLTDIREITLRDKDAFLTISQNRILFASAVLVPVNLIAGMWMLYTSIGSNWKEAFLCNDDSFRYIDSPASHSEVIASDGGLFRIANSSLTGVNGRPENIAMLNDYYGVTYWFSVVNQYVMKYANTLFEENKKWRSFGFNNNEIYETAAGVKYYMTDEPDTVPDMYILREEIEFNDDTWFIFENPDFYGMAYVRNAGAAMELQSGDIDYEQYFGHIAENRSGMVKDIDYDNEKNVLECLVEAENEENELVVLLPYNGNWKAYIDGREVTVARTDIMYLSIPVEKGSHRVVIRYTSPAAAAGIFCMLISAACLVILTGKRDRNGCADSAG